MKFEFELTEYICLYVDQNGYTDCVLSNDLDSAYDIYEKYNIATIINIDCTKNTRSILKQKTNINMK